MLRNFQYRLYPTKSQKVKLNRILEACRMTYNGFLSERKTAWEERKESIGYYSQAPSLVELKRLHPGLKEVHSQILQNVAVRVDLAFKAFFRRCKAGEDPGFPRFKGFGNYDSFTFPQAPSGCSIEDSVLKVSKVGNIKIRLHRPLKGVQKTATVKRTSSGKWFVTFSCETEPEPLNPTGKSVGIDVGLHSFAYLSDGTEVPNPKFVRKEERELARTQRRLSRCAKGTSERKRAKVVVAKVHERIGNRRKDFADQISRKIVNQYDRIFVEDLHVNRMVHNHCLAKSIMDAGWSSFFSKLAYKAESAGREFAKINPAYTSQTCSSCGHRQKMPLGERTFDCPCCKVSIHRDLNAALNILSLGQQALGLAAPGSPRL